MSLIPLSDRFLNLRNDFANDDYAGMATVSDLEEVACECIVRNRRREGCELLSAYIRLTANSKVKRIDAYVREVLVRLDDAERILVA